MGTGTPLKIGLSGQGPTTAVTGNHCAPWILLSFAADAATGPTGCEQLALRLLAKGFVGS